MVTIHEPAESLRKAHSAKLGVDSHQNDLLFICYTLTYKARIFGALSLVKKNSREYRKTTFNSK